MISKPFTPAPYPARVLAKFEVVAFCPSNKVNYIDRPVGPIQHNIAYKTPTVNTVSGTET
jgi:hypothetical protein